MKVWRRDKGECTDARTIIFEGGGTGRQSSRQARGTWIAMSREDIGGTRTTTVRRRAQR